TSTSSNAAIFADAGTVERDCHSPFMVWIVRSPSQATRPTCLLLRDAPPQVGFDERVEVAVEDFEGIAGLEVHPVVLDELLRLQHVVPDRLAAEADLRLLAAMGGQFGVLLLLLHLIQLGE